MLRGVTRDLTKLVGVLATAPLIERKKRDGWLLVKPPVVLMIVGDPDVPYDTPEGVAEERRKILDEIVNVIQAQGVDPDRAALETLVRVTTWSEKCFEFEHFTDRELARALTRIHATHGGLDEDELTTAVSEQRRARRDVKQVWKNWFPPQS